VDAGLASLDGEQYRMTKAGFEALTGPAEEPNQVAGPAALELQPGEITSDARG
jgi:hypothetical protein